MKRILYSLYAVGFALVLAGGVILFTPPTTVYACTGSPVANLETPSLFQSGPLAATVSTTMAVPGLRMARPTVKSARRKERKN